MNEEHDLEPVWKALADPTRRRILDLLRAGPRTTTDLSAEFAMTRYGVMKHLGVLESAGVVTARKSGRRKYHYLNPIPIRQIHDRWISRYAEPWARMLVNLKQTLEGDPMSQPRFLFEIHIRTTPEHLWAAITQPDLTRQYFYSTEFHSRLVPGAPLAYRMPDGSTAVEGEVVEVDPPRRLVTTWRALYDPEVADDAPSRVTWEIEPQGETCRLTLIHDDFDGETATYRQVSAGWPAILSSLKSLVETGTALPLAG